MKLLQKKQVIVGLGEIGSPILKLISQSSSVIGYDINPKLINKTLVKRYEHLQSAFLHICIPYNDKFILNIILNYKKFKPEGIIIHSTIRPYTTKKLQEKLSVPVIYSATRGVHKRMLKDLQRYTKFFAIEKNAPKRNWAITAYQNLMKKCGVTTKQISTPLTLELAKIVVDTSYYGWLINYAQLSNMIAKEHNVNYDEMWSFADEIHKFLGNRPKMFPGFIGGHCVIPNLDLINDSTLNLIKDINSDYSKILRRRKQKS